MLISFFGTKAPERYPEILYNALTSNKRTFYPDDYDGVDARRRPSGKARG